MEYRAILATKRTTLVESVPEWLEDRAAQLFQLEPQGAATFELTVEWSYPTEWLLARYRDELFDAARRGVEHAMQALIIGFFQCHSGYDIEAFLAGLQPRPSVVKLAGTEVARMVQQCDSGTDELSRGVDF